MTRNNFYTAGLVILLLAIGVNTYFVIDDHGRVGSDEAATCTIQSRGLRGQHHLTEIMADVAELLTPAPRTPPSTATPLIAPLANLREQVGAYVTIEGEQPKHRKC